MSAPYVFTSWFSSKIDKPSRHGVYNVSCSKHSHSGSWYAYWDGETWYAFSLTTYNAVEYFKEQRTGASTVTWRGLFKE